MGDYSAQSHPGATTHISPPLESKESWQTAEGGRPSKASTFQDPSRALIKSLFLSLSLLVATKLFLALLPKPCVVPFSGAATKYNFCRPKVNIYFLDRYLRPRVTINWILASRSKCFHVAKSVTSDHKLFHKRACKCFNQVSLVA